ncbi:group II intron reverse transcriptase/maturase [Carboxylicivirga marina]|uniref:Group II intron reverse transcriptase/maturase n=1 Tax=Carboxylicivirga marina TaxID=2800988 RepID=A0ABS1HR98_9BACT|nr:group II intron reverse transcriptase/maturase [Carboxylicivirga marina]MBK3520035.1 group II intron reverse transcriptase/maturase [Carboxylicivirga marina]
MNLWNETKSIPVSQEMIWSAYKKVKANKGSAGVDSVSMEEFETNKSKHLYKLWNRMSSGSYFPPPVKEVEILKKDGKMRKLGIPTISDRIGQMVIKDFIEPRMENVFSPSSYGYRPNKNAHQALASVRANCWQTDWVIDLDIKGFFDNIDHEKLMLAVNKHVPENWVRMYIVRWLEMPVQLKSGVLEHRQGKGTPQGGVISPLLANLYLHYALDKWLELTNPTLKFARYADDAIIHCKNKEQAEYLLRQLNARMKLCGLELHPDKTKVVYCKDRRRRGKYEIVKFDFLGYSFQPRTTLCKKTSKLFLGFDCAISINSRKRIADKLEEIKVEKLSFRSIVGVAHYLNPMIRGWVNYYGKFRKSELMKVFQLLRKRIVRWARMRYKRYKTKLNLAYRWYERIKKQFPYLFYHWQVGLTC